MRVNILGLTPLDFSVNGQDRSIADLLRRQGFEVVSRWAMGSSLEEISRSASADADLVVSASGLAAAKVLAKRYGIPYIVGTPVGRMLPDVLAERIREAALRPGAPDCSAASGGCSAIQGMIACSGADAAARRGRTYEKGFAAVIGEGVTSLSLARAIESERGIPAKVLCATDCPDGILRGCDLMTPDEDDIISALAGAEYVIADPLYAPAVPAAARFIALPSEAFSGRIYRADIPDLTACADSMIGAL